MSKMDSLRALREARYEQEAARGRVAAAATRPVVSTGSVARAAEPRPEEAVDRLCGHRSTDGRTCLRETGHAAKRHRYA